LTRVDTSTPILTYFGKLLLFLPPIPGHCFGLIPAPGSFAASAFPVPPLHHWVPSHKAAARFGSSSPRFWVPQKMGQKKEIFFMSYLNSVTIIGFAGADPEQRQARNNGSKFTVFSLATQTLVQKTPIMTSLAPWTAFRLNAFSLDLRINLW
jgi:hypothetical protein